MRNPNLTKGEAIEIIHETACLLHAVIDQCKLESPELAADACVIVLRDYYADSGYTEEEACKLIKERIDQHFKDFLVAKVAGG